MTIDSTTVVFPNNAVNLLAQNIILIDSGLYIAKRPLRPTDPNQSVGIFAAQWMPDEESHEMRGKLFHDPSLESYTLAIQGFIKDADEERGLATHSVLSELIRSMLYRNEAVRVGLSSLNTQLSGVKKRCHRWGISSQRYYSNEISGSWLYLSTLEFWLEVETS